jgi:hypothetical protein
VKRRRGEEGRGKREEEKRRRGKREEGRGKREEGREDRRGKGSKKDLQGGHSARPSVRNVKTSPSKSHLTSTLLSTVAAGRRRVMKAGLKPGRKSVG